MNDKTLHVATKIMVMAIVLSVMLLFAAVGLLILIQFCVFGRAFRRGGFVNSAILERGGQGSSDIVISSMSRDELEKLPCYNYVVKDNNMESKSPLDCAVCLENYISGDKCRLLPKCRHSFHAACVDAWLLKTPFCPICRTTTARDDVSHSVNVGESSHFSDVSFRSGWSRSTAESSQLSDISIDLRESQRTEGNSNMHDTYVTSLQDE